MIVWSKFSSTENKEVNKISKAQTCLDPHGSRSDGTQHLRPTSGEIFSLSTTENCSHSVIHVARSPNALGCVYHGKLPASTQQLNVECS